MRKNTMKHNTQNTSITNMNETEKPGNLRPEYGLCSCCLELWSLKSLWAEYSWMGGAEAYGDMVNECFNLHWVQGLRNERICEVCVTQLRIALMFRQQLIACHNKLTQVDINNESNVIKPELKSIENETKRNMTSGDVLDETVHQTKENSPRCDDDFHDNDTQMHTVESIPVKPESAKEDNIIKNQKHQCESKKPIRSKAANSEKLINTSAKRKLARIKNIKPTKFKTNYMKARHDACMILGNSTILPFKSNRGYFNCFYCNMQYVEFQELKSHVTENHANIDFKSISKSILRPKDKIRADVGKIVCKLCEREIPNLNKLVVHLTENHALKFNNKKPIDCLVPYNLSDGKFICHECGAEFLFFKTLSQHMNEHSTDYVCAVCGRCFLLPERLRAHAQMHDTEKSMQCEFCTKIFTSKILLKSHIRYTHKKICWKCSICDEIFNNYRSRLEHLERIHNRTPLNLICKVCLKIFKAPNSLNAHVRLEHMKIVKESKFGCVECGMMFKSRHALTYHSTVHSGEKNFECDVCHKKYARSKTLVEHLKIHYNDRRWCCGACAQCFVQKCSLKNHIRVHHVECCMDQLIVYKKPIDK